jgi:hypothetical protein
LREAQRRLRELEAENSRLRAATTPVTPTQTTEPY